ncbi:MAG: single-stranded-DNA-specific exonuclease RecJ [Alphaproteobacteria bacterium]|nr:single-stranded-DNA-specific exonuclease RecJ [Alphaproteobacteria bacterium]
MSVLGVSRSVNGLKWTYKNTDDRLALAISQRFDLPDIVSRILSSRISSIDEAHTFLYPTLKNNLPNPFSLKDMEKAARRMAQAIIKNEPIGLMGDYDVDGATSTALLKMFLESLGVIVFAYIPDREDGYGPSAKKMHEYHEKGCSVVATLDCGMTAFDPIQEGTDLGLDVIVLDHHDADEKRYPNAYAIVNPKRLDEDPDHPCHFMAAVGVVFLFTVALNTVLRELGFYKDKSEPNLIKYLDLVAFGTVCDVVKLKGVNRLFVKAGLKQMQTQNNLGIKALATLVKLSEPASAYHLGYVFGPRINACGRVGKSDIGMKLLSSSEIVTATRLAEELEALNLTRREIETSVLLEAIEQVESKPIDTPFLVVEGEKWHQGVVGIVAGRLKDKYNLPVFALSIEEDEIKGSSRSVQGVDLGTLVMNAIQLGILSRGGGHPMAAGFSLKKENLPAFKAYLKEVIKEDMLSNDGTMLEIDAVIDAKSATVDLMDNISLLAPFGESNPEPIFVLKEMLVTRTTILKNGHIACTLSSKSGKYINAIAFRSVDTDLGAKLLSKEKLYLHVAGTLKKDSWRGNTKVQMQILDIAMVE